MSRGSARGELGISNGGDATGLLGSDGARLPIGTLASPVDGYVVTYDSATGALRLEAPSAAGVGGSTGSTDNRVIRADGTGGATVQSSAVGIDDSGNVTGVGTLDIGNADTTLSRAAAGVVAVEGVNLLRGSTGSTDNALLRADGTGGSLGQASAVIVGDALTGDVAEVSSARLVRGVRTISSSPDTQLQADDVLYFSAALTVNLLASCTTGRTFTYVCTAAATLTLTPGGSDTINGGSAGASLAIACAAGQQVVLTRSASGAWRAVLPAVAIGVEAYISGGVMYASAVTLDSTGAPVRIGTPVAMTAEGTTYSESISGTDITLTGPLTGDTGAIQSNSRRYYVALSALGISLSTTNRRWASMHAIMGSLSANSEARAGTVDLGCYLGVGSTTALCGVSVYRPSTGSTYGVEHFQTSATAFTNVGTSTAVRGFTSRHSWPSDAGMLQTASLDSVGAYLASATSSGAVLSGSAPTHFVVFIRSTASASGAVFGNPRFLALFGPQITAL